MNKHSSTRILNYALRYGVNCQYLILGYIFIIVRQVLTGNAVQRGSLIAPERLRFDFTNKAAMTEVEVKKFGDTANTVIDQNQEMYAKEHPLAVARTILGLRACFDETYSHLVRVVSVGVPDEKLEAGPNSPEDSKTNIAFCGGTRLRRAGHLEQMVSFSLCF